MPTTENARWVTEPFVAGSPEQFARLREWLIGVGYTEPVLSGKANVRTTAHLHALRDRKSVV